MTTTKTKQSYEVKGSDVIEKIKNIITEANIRRIKITDKSGNKLLDIPLTFGVVGTIIAPLLAVLGTTLAITTQCTITVERIRR